EPGAGNLFGGSLTIAGNRNVVQGNLFGTDVTGTVSLPVTSAAGVCCIPAQVDIQFGETNLIGGLTDSARNIISVGVSISGDHNTVQGNYIGTDITGTRVLASAETGFANTGITGVFVPGNFNSIGGAAPGAGNLISGFALFGMRLDGHDNFVQGNRIGTDGTGTKGLGNRAGVVFGGFNNTIGGLTPGAGNLISGNRGVGLSGGGLTNLVQGNFIGTDVTGTLALGNGGGIEASGGMIGGTEPGA